MVIQRPIHYVHQSVHDEKVKNISGSDNLVTNTDSGPQMLKAQHYLTEHESTVPVPKGLSKSPWYA